MERLRDGGRTSGPLAPLTLIFDQQLRLVFGSKFAIPERELDVSPRQPILDVDLPAPNFDKAARVGHSLTVSLSERPLEIGRFNPLAAGVSENRQRRMLPVVAAVMCPMRQPIVIADQVTMKFDRLFNAATSFPVIFAKSSLNSKLTLDQILPGMPFVVHVVTNAEPLIDALEIVADELASMIGDYFFPQPPTQQRMEIDVQDHADPLLGRERAGEDGSGKALQQQG